MTAFFRARWWRHVYLPLLLLALLPTITEYHRARPRAAVWSDSEGYYVYVPGIFNLESIHALPPGALVQQNEWGAYVTKYTCGVALFETPLFLIARAVADAHGVDRRDIFHPYYIWSVVATGWLVAALGLLLLQRALRERGFAEPVVALTIAGTLLGTNLFHYVVREPGMSHVYSFALLAAVALLLLRFYANPTRTRAALLGAALGWLVLIRPTVVLVLPVVVLFDVYSGADLRARLIFWRRHWSLLALAGLVGALFLVPQLLYWHSMFGQWVKYSYAGEGFPYWNRPKVLAVLFDSQNGLFTYSPLVLLSVAGLALGWRDRRVQAPALTLVFGLITWVFASWWAWWFGGAFGHRCYVEYYALLAFPLALVFERVLALRRPGLKALALLIIAFLLFYAVRLDYLYAAQGRPWDGPEWRWNLDLMRALWAQLFRF